MPEVKILSGKPEAADKAETALFHLVIPKTTNDILIGIMPAGRLWEGDLIVFTQNLCHSVRGHESVLTHELGAWCSTARKKVWQRCGSKCRPTR